MTPRELGWWGWGGRRGGLAVNVGARSDDAASTTVHRLLITTVSFELRVELWVATCEFSHWLDGRENGDRITWLTTVDEEDLPAFLDAAEGLGVTVEEIEGAGEAESYRLLVGAAGSGWQGGDAR